MNNQNGETSQFVCQQIVFKNIAVEKPERIYIYVQ